MKQSGYYKSVSTSLIGVFLKLLQMIWILNHLDDLKRFKIQDFLFVTYIIIHNITVTNSASEAPSDRNQREPSPEY